MSVNKVMLLGRLGQDPELKYTASGTAVCNFNLATSEQWTDKATGQKQEKTEWSRIVVWGKIAELCSQYLNKGSQAFIEGQLQTRQWEDKEGIKRYTTEINARQVQFVGGQPQQGQQQGQPQQGQPQQGQAQQGQPQQQRPPQQQQPQQQRPPQQQQPQQQQPPQQQADYNMANDQNFSADDIPF